MTGKHQSWLHGLLLIPPVVAACLLSLRWHHKQAFVPIPEAIKQEAPMSEQQKREYVLEVMGMGVTLDKYRQGKLWEALQNGTAHSSIREQDIKKYLWNSLEREGLAGGRGGDTLENGAAGTPMYFGVPIFDAEPPIYNSRLIDRPDDPIIGLAGGAKSSGMHWHLFVIAERRAEEHPDRVLEEVFAFFDAHPDVAYVILNAEDSMPTRDLYRPDNTPELVRNGYYIPEMPDASALFVLARRERIDAVRPFAFKDAPPEDSVDNLNSHGVARRLFLVYDELTRSVPTPKAYSPGTRAPLVHEWLPVAARFAQRSDIRGTGNFSLLHKLSPRDYHPPRDWQPTPWFPLPFNQEQLAQVDRLPTLGFIHRPTFVSFKDADGKPLTRRDQRLQALHAGWQQALLTLPGTERAASPARVVTATSGDTAQTVMLHQMLTRHAEHGGPELDSSNSAHWIDTDKRLGNTGAATLFVQMAIGVMGSYRDGGISAAINLRNREEASIVFISPPSEEKRRTQQHPKGGDVFRHYATPAIDPANYPSN